VYVGVIGLAMTDIVWIISTTRMLRVPRMDCFILAEEGQCYKYERDKIFSKDKAEHEPC
jgi:hypothetical protein